MKHCPLCEFTFDDETEFCDFDGSELKVVPESPPAFDRIKFEPAASRSSVRRIVRSRAVIAALTLAAVLVSALLIGYYDSMNQGSIDTTGNEPPSELRPDRGDSVTPSSETSEPTTNLSRPRQISTQRLIGVDELPSAMIKRLLGGSGRRSLKSMRTSSSAKKMAIHRGPSRTRLVATKRKSRNVNRGSQARNQARRELPNTGRRQHTLASAPSSRLGGRPQTVANMRADQRHPSNFEILDSQTEIRPGSHRRNSRVIAVLKKTGSILKRPFELIAGR